MNEFTPLDPDTFTTAAELNAELLAALARGRTAPNVDWVTARGACMPRETFARLLAGVRMDVDGRNRQLEESQFKLVVTVADEQSLFSVTAYVEQRPLSSVSFKLEGTKVQAERQNSESLHGTAVVDVDGRCKWRVEGELLEEWQFRMRALNELFFPAAL